jgi:hypothetical protein
MMSRMPVCVPADWATSSPATGATYPVTSRTSPITWTTTAEASPRVNVMTPVNEPALRRPVVRSASSRTSPNITHGMSWAPDMPIATAAATAYRPAVGQDDG